MKYVRAGALVHYAMQAQAAGLDPEEQLRMVGLSLEELRDPQAWIPVDAAAHLLHHAARSSGQEDFGLRIAAGRPVSVIGPLALLAYVESTIRQALKSMIRYQVQHTSSAHVQLIERDGLAYCHVEIELSQMVPRRQAMEFALATVHLVLAALLGQQWRALQICFRHGPPRSGTHASHFGTAVEYNSESDCIVLRSCELDSRIATSDETLAQELRDYLAKKSGPAVRHLHLDVRELVNILIVSGNCSAEAVARRLGMPVRTFYLRLKQENITFAGIVDEVRRKQVLAHLDNPCVRLTDISSLLGFSSLPAFSRWFRQRFGCTASTWIANNHRPHLVSDGLHPRWRE